MALVSVLPWIRGSWTDDLSFVAVAGLPPVRESTRPCSPTRRAFSPLPTQPDAPTTQSTAPATAALKKAKKKAAKAPPPPRPVKVEQGTEVGPSLAGSHTTSDGESFPQLNVGAERMVQVAGTTEAPAEIEVHDEPVPEPHEPAPRPPLAVVDGGTQQPAIKQEREATGSVPSQPRRRRDPSAPKPPPSAPPAEIIDITSSSSAEEDQQ